MVIKHFIVIILELSSGNN